jgi:2-keto-3-deoxy-L-rhamnonate aldolase RhmA
MRQNIVKDKLAAGQTCFGTMVFELLSPGLPRILELAGADFVIYDMEHSGQGIDPIRQQLALCRGTALVPIVRPPAALSHLTGPLLDAGAMGLKIPNVETREQAERIVRSTRYPPEGERGAAFGIAHDDYLADPLAAMASANRNLLVLAQIESERGLDNVEEIMAVPGIDVAWLGHFDLTISMGIPGQFEHPRFLEALDRIVEAAERRGKAAGFLAANENVGRAWMRHGFRAVLYSRDTMLLARALKEGLTRLREP